MPALGGGGGGGGLGQGDNASMGGGRKDMLSLGQGDNASSRGGGGGGGACLAWDKVTMPAWEGGGAMDAMPGGAMPKSLPCFQAAFLVCR